MFFSTKARFLWGSRTLAFRKRPAAPVAVPPSKNKDNRTGCSLERRAHSRKIPSGLKRSFYAFLTDGDPPLPCHPQRTPTVKTGNRGVSWIKSSLSSPHAFSVSKLNSDSWYSVPCVRFAEISLVWCKTSEASRRSWKRRSKKKKSLSTFAGRGLTFSPRRRHCFHDLHAEQPLKKTVEQQAASFRSKIFLDHSQVRVCQLGSELSFCPNFHQTLLVCVYRALVQHAFTI